MSKLLQFPRRRNPATLAWKMAAQNFRHGDMPVTLFFPMFMTVFTFALLARLPFHRWTLVQVAQEITREFEREFEGAR